jgi:hypothetical protein
MSNAALEFNLVIESVDSRVKLARAKMAEALSLYKPLLPDEAAAAEDLGILPGSD